MQHRVPAEALDEVIDLEPVPRGFFPGTRLLSFSQRVGAVAFRLDLRAFSGQLADQGLIDHRLPTRYKGVAPRPFGQANFGTEQEKTDVHQEDRGTEVRLHRPR